MADYIIIFFVFVPRETWIFMDESWMMSWMIIHIDRVTEYGFSWMMS